MSRRESRSEPSPETGSLSSLRKAYLSARSFHSCDSMRSREIVEVNLMSE